MAAHVVFSVEGFHLDGVEETTRLPLRGSSEAVVHTKEQDQETQVVDSRPARRAADPLRLVGTEVGGRYVVERMVAGGSMGHVYEAIQRPFGRTVALKVLSVDRQQTDPRFYKRFRREASVASQLSHPNIVTIYDFGSTPDGDVYMAMEYLPGRPLSQVIKTEGPLEPRRALNVAIQVARALRRAHRVGIVHRDLKPANIVVTPDEDDLDFVKVLDFGLVKMFSDAQDWGDAYADEQLTTAGTMLGTPGYMAPEQAIGDAVDLRADIYALGVVLFHMLTGRLPYEGHTIQEIVSEQVSKPVPQLTQVAPHLSVGPSLEPVLNRCLARSPQGRYDRIDDLLSALKGVWRLENDDTFGTETGLIPLDLAALQPLAPSDPTQAMVTPRPEPRIQRESLTQPIRVQPVAWTLVLMVGLLMAAGLGIGTALWLVPAPSPADANLPLLPLPASAVPEPAAPVVPPTAAPDRPPLETYKDNPY